MGRTIDLSGRVALVTGGGRGIGKAIAGRLAEAGADVVIASRKLPNLEATAAELAGLAGRVVPIACHLGRKDQVEDLVRETESTLGPVDILSTTARRTLAKARHSRSPTTRSIRWSRSTSRRPCAWCG